jgi:hypothetical protein
MDGAREHLSRVVCIRALLFWVGYLVFSGSARMVGSVSVKFELHQRRLYGIGNVRNCGVEGNTPATEGEDG